MIDFVGTHPFYGIALRVAMVTMHFHIGQTGLVLGNIVFRILGIRETNWHQRKIVLLRVCKVGQIIFRGI